MSAPDPEVQRPPDPDPVIPDYDPGPVPGEPDEPADEPAEPAVTEEAAEPDVGPEVPDEGDADSAELPPLPDPVPDIPED